MTDEKKIMKGTTTVGIVFDNGVVLAADKRATMGTFIAAKDVEKIQPVSDRLALTMAGSVGDAQQLARVLKAEAELYKYSRGRELTVQGASTLLANVLQGNKFFPYLVQIIVAGVDSKPRLFDLDPFGGLLEENYVSTGSGSVVAYGVLDEHFKKSMNEEDALRLAAKAVNAAMKRDNATGEGIDLVAITQNGLKRVPKDQVDQKINS
ncbi:MAG: archaeal proteasome endopeptidase complex subunit beta [Candidatus Micrarchaeia archaeon]